MKTLLSALRRAIAPMANPAAPLYAVLVAEARQPHWYLDGGVPDTLDGRFDMLVAVLAFALFRLEAEDPAFCARLTDCFIGEMDASLRQDGVGDQSIARHVGRMVAAFGGRLTAYRDAGGDDAALGKALRRNLWRGEAVADDAVAFVVAGLRGFAARLTATPTVTLIAGRIAAEG